ncbi:hypothetical protein MSHOH_3129 [Methanosarcina horonobensis HB-1 = JCM 15518]|uniref:Uncharacterized protein n=1 Tax=Methanosarcina horonobensis HB-1 = JCM 15518 TaxID=1434110 RepID=A0A0E3SGT7_9EURY|nr:hypothetical protein [Methanosarcina horonobensis]AKB79612.1 hypothetical protein MSHOH_3129 [Methanosarcina horonobensis HB-1 = JCM 15518]
MVYYYSLRRQETELKILFTTGVIFSFFICYIEKYISGFTAILLFFMYIYSLMSFSPNIFKLVINNIFAVIIICLSFFAILFWYFKIDALPMGSINDNQMLIFVTLLYVFLTYKTMKSNFSIYQHQRMPQLLIDIANNDSKALFMIKNISDFHAVELLVTFEILYPIPVSTFSTIKLFIVRSLFKKRKNDYIIHYFLEYLEPKSTADLDIEQEIQCLIDKEAITKKRGLDIIGEDLHVIVKYEYKSLDNLDLEKPFYKRFKFKIHPTGSKLVHKSGNPVKLD